MSLLVRSKAFATVLLIAFVASTVVLISFKNDTAVSLRRQLSEEVEELSEFLGEAAFVGEDADIFEQESLAAITEQEEDPIEDQEVGYFLASPDDFDVHAVQLKEEFNELEVTAHEYEEAMMQAQVFEDQAVYERKKARARSKEEGTQEAAVEAVQADLMASQILEEVEAAEEEILNKEEILRAQIEELQGFAEERRRHLVKKIQNFKGDTTTTTLNGITYNHDANE